MYRIYKCKEMKILKTSFYLLSFVLLAFSCKHSENPERNKIYEEVMAIHDEVMPEMKTIHYLEKNLKKKAAQTQSQDSLIMINGTITRVQEAGESMMDWMHKLDIPGKKVPDEEAIAYFKSEKVKITAVSRKMKKAITSGKLWLGEK